MEGDFRATSSLNRYWNTSKGQKKAVIEVRSTNRAIAAAVYQSLSTVEPTSRLVAVIARNQVQLKTTYRSVNLKQSREKRKGYYL